MEYYDVVNCVTVTKTNMINEMHCGYGPLRTTGVKIWHQVCHRASAEVSAALEVSHRSVQSSVSNSNRLPGFGPGWNSPEGP